MHLPISLHAPVSSYWENSRKDLHKNKTIAFVQFWALYYFKTPGLISSAFDLSFTRSNNIISSFKKTGIWPFKPTVFDEEFQDVLAEINYKHTLVDQASVFDQENKRARKSKRPSEAFTPGNIRPYSLILLQQRECGPTTRKGKMCLSYNCQSMPHAIQFHALHLTYFARLNMTHRSPFFSFS